MEDFHQWLTENSYTRQEELVFADCDRNRNARISALLGKAAAFAGYDYDARGLTYEVLYEKREVFLLSRIALRIHSCPRAGDVLTVTLSAECVEEIGERVPILTEESGSGPS